MNKIRRPLARVWGAAGAATLVLAGSIAAAGCGSAQAVRHPGPPPAGPCSQQVKQLDQQAAAAALGEPPAVRGSIDLAAAALLTAKVVVTPAASGPTCQILTPGKTVDLRVGWRVVFVANEAPALTGAQGSVSVATSPGPSSSFLGQPPTSHLVVTLTAVRPGAVSLQWIDCSGTGC
jgi:hypothetical protein